MNTRDPLKDPRVGDQVLNRHGQTLEVTGRPVSARGRDQVSFTAFTGGGGHGRLPERAITRRCGIKDWRKQVNDATVLLCVMPPRPETIRPDRIGRLLVQVERVLVGQSIRVERDVVSGWLQREVLWAVEVLGLVSCDCCGVWGRRHAMTLVDYRSAAGNGLDAPEWYGFLCDGCGARR